MSSSTKNQPNLRNRPVTPGRPNLNLAAQRAAAQPQLFHFSNNQSDIDNKANNRKRSRKLLSGSLEELNKEVESLCSNDAITDYPITVNQNNEPISRKTNNAQLKDNNGNNSTKVKIHGVNREETKKSLHKGINNLLSGKSPPDGRRAPIPGAYSNTRDNNIRTDQRDKLSYSRQRIASLATQQASQCLSQSNYLVGNAMSNSLTNFALSNENAVDFTSYYVKKRSPTAREKLEDAYLPKSNHMGESSRSNSDKSSPEHMGHIKNLANPARSPLNFFALDNNNREEPEGAESPESCVSSKYIPGTTAMANRHMPISFTHEFCRRSDVSVTRPKPRREQNYHQIRESISNLSLGPTTGNTRKFSPSSNKLQEKIKQSDSNTNALKLNPGLNTLNTLQQDIFNSRRPGKKYSSAFSVSSGYSSTNSNSNFSVASSRALPEGKPGTKPGRASIKEKEGSLNLTQRSVFADYTRGLN